MCFSLFFYGGFINPAVKLKCKFAVTRHFLLYLIIFEPSAILAFAGEEARELAAAMTAKAFFLKV